MHYAENVKTAAELIKAGANVNAQNNEGVAPIHYFAGRNEGNLCKLLMQNGADVNIQANDGRTAIDYASEYSYNFKELLTILSNKSVETTSKTKKSTKKSKALSPS